MILIVTNALNIAMEFVHAEDIGVIVIGGEMRHRIVCCTGELTMDALNNFCFDRAFLLRATISASSAVSPRRSCPRRK